MTNLTDINFPVNFRDVHYIALTYVSSFDAVNKKLEGTDLQAGLIFNGKPLVAVGLIEYNDSDLGAYNEVIIAIPVVPKGTRTGLSNWLDLYGAVNKRKLGQYIIHIPVTSQLSMDAGIDLWGYPKTIKKIDHSFYGNKISSGIWNEVGDEKIIEFKGSMGVGIPIPTMNLLTYSFQDGHTLKTEVEVNSNMKWKPFADIRITVKETTDPICRDIIDLGICNKKPFFTIEASNFKAKFNKGISLLEEASH
jgi:hypothetical protein